MIKKNLIFHFIPIVLLISILDLLAYASESFQQFEVLNAKKSQHWRIDFFNAWKKENGSHQYALFIDLNDGWKTYWKNPGESGFTPEFEILSTNNLKGFEVSWPIPDIFVENETTIYGFKEKLILPIIFYPQKIERPFEFHFKLKMGFCKDICIPRTFYFRNGTAMNSSKLQNNEILKFLSKVPINLQSSKKYVSCKVVRDGEKLQLISSFNPKFFKNENKIKDVIFSYQNKNIWFTEKTYELNEKIQNFSVILNNANNGKILLDRSKIELTLITHSKGFILEGCQASEF
mgnify:CR=1 FL=1